jgi:hypothetical protein
MLKLLSNAISAIFRSLSRFCKNLSLQRSFSVVLVGFLLLTSSVDSADLPQSTKDMLNDMIARGENGRPVTTRQWQAEKREVEGQPGKRAERIVKESADAVDEMSEIYPDNAKTLTPGVENGPLERDD